MIFAPKCNIMEIQSTEEKTLKTFEVIFKDGKTLTIKVEGIENQLQVYNLICQNNLAADRGGVEQIREKKRG